jgi:hypothetical protein
VGALVREIAAPQDDNCAMWAAFSRLAGAAHSAEHEAAGHDRKIADIGARFARAAADMDALSAAYDGPLRDQLEKDADRAGAALDHPGSRSGHRTQGSSREQLKT